MDWRTQMKIALLVGNSIGVCLLVVTLCLPEIIGNSNAPLAMAARVPVTYAFTAVRDTGLLGEVSMVASSGNNVAVEYTEQVARFNTMIATDKQHVANVTAVVKRAGAKLKMLASTPAQLADILGEIAKANHQAAKGFAQARSEISSHGDTPKPNAVMCSNPQSRPQPFNASQRDINEVAKQCNYDGKHEEDAGVAIIDSDQ